MYIDYIDIAEKFLR